MCGAGHFEDVSSLCHACSVAFDQPEEIETLYRIENVATHPAERITANDEERQRQGFELQTTFEWATRDGARDVRRADVKRDGAALLQLAYGPGATITRLNKGLRRRANPGLLGYYIDPASGYWTEAPGNATGPTPPTQLPPQLIVPMVRDQKNALLVQVVGATLAPAAAATVQHAFLRGMESVYQLEEGEVFAEPMPSREKRAGFLLYEATEGGAGVLSRLVAEPGAVAEIARRALSIAHLRPEKALPPRSVDDLVDDAADSCVAGCYRCLLSYYNQPDHELIDRRDADARAFLVALANANTTPRAAPPPPVAATGDALLDRWHAQADGLHLPPPDARPVVAQGHSFTLVWAQHYVYATLEAPPEEALRAMADRGFERVDFSPREGRWSDTFVILGRLLGTAP